MDLWFVPAWSAPALWRLAAALAGAWALDAAFGEPPNRWHPVAWLGTALQPLTRWLPTLLPVSGLLAGSLAWVVVVGGVLVLAVAAQALLLAAPAWCGVPLLALLLKPSLAWRMLHDEVAAVGQALASAPAGSAASLAAGRLQVARLCSRDVWALDADGVVETAVETLAENLNDSLVAPLWWCVLLGLPGAWAWRAVNTLDAMWGYRGRWDAAGKCAARADDLLAWLPARLSALLLAPPSWRALWRQAGLTPSPNGGWPMAAMALHLGVRLRKPGVYTLNAGAPSPGLAQLQRALQRGRQAAWAATGLALATLAVLAATAGPGA
ncbi:MAG: cobalamin biosynthesis protein CobD [Burkholderiales bacterium PBB5]|nr:MAG: cobalamin biosynthesis protein CobD [Burkholderiales bacterium PBB5]